MNGEENRNDEQTMNGEESMMNAKKKNNNFVDEREHETWGRKKAMINFEFEKRF